MRPYRGVTLFELITVVAVIAIVAVIALPSLKRLSDHNRITAEANALVGDLQFARQRAVQTARRVVVCPVVNGACTSDWSKGWTVFRNDHYEYPPVLGTQDRIIRVHRPSGNTLTLGSNQSFFAFRPLGSSIAGRIEICSADLDLKRSVIISRVGRIRADSAPSSGSSLCDAD